MKLLISLLVAGLFVPAAWAQSRFYGEAGVSYFSLRDPSFERGPSVFSVRNGKPDAAPFLAAGYSFTEAFGLRLSYHYVDEVASTVESDYSHLVDAPVTIPVMVWSRYRDTIHLVGLAPELRWVVREKLRVTFAPTVNWVVNRGDVRTYTTSPLISIIPWSEHNDEGLTFGGSLGIVYSLTDRLGFSAAYHYADLDPSWDRQAHILSGGLRWNF